MSTNGGAPNLDPSSLPELTQLGKRLEMLRIERGISKQQLARFAGTSRQQLWRVMTGKSDLTVGLRQRLADTLRVDTSALAAPDTVWTGPTRTHADTQPATLAFDAVVSLEEFVADAAHVERAVRSLPCGDAGRELKRALLNALEDQAVRYGLTLDTFFFNVRRRVLSGEL